MLHKRYLLKMKTDSILSKEGLTCWVVRALDLYSANKPVAIKVYKHQFLAVLAQELDTSRRLSRNDPFKWASLVEIRDTFQVELAMKIE